MATTYTKGFNKPRIAGVYCEWEQQENGDWELRRLDTNEVVAHITNLRARKDYRAKIGDELIVDHEQYLPCAKCPIEQELDKRWSA